jgi:hypothetical protein
LRISEDQLKELSRGKKERVRGIMEKYPAAARNAYKSMAEALKLLTEVNGLLMGK